MSIATLLNDENFKRDAQSDWASTNFTVYALLRPDANPDSVSRKITRLVHANALEPGTILSHSMQPLKDIHLKSAGIADGARNSNVDSIPQGNPVYITVFSFIAIFVLTLYYSTKPPFTSSSHLFGFFSVFNPNAVKDVKLFKAGIPSQYGGRLSSLGIRMKEGNIKNLIFRWPGYNL